MSSPNRRVLDRFYAAVQKKDPEEVALSIEEGFAPDVVLRLSDSLPYGGVYEGRETIKNLLVKLVTTRRPIVIPDQIVVDRIVEQGDQIVVEPVFPWLAPGATEPIRMSAVEWFTFRDGRVTEMKVVYWDTAACLKAMDEAASATSH